MVASFTSADVDYTNTQSVPVIFVISQATPTVAVTDGGTYNGHAFAATATVAGVVPGLDSNPSGALEGVPVTLTYYAGSTELSGAPVNAGTYTVVASFAGSTDYSAASGSSTFVISAAGTSTTLAGPTGSTSYGQTATFTAIVSAVGGYAGAPSGTVLFEDGSTVLGSVALDSSGEAQLALQSLAAGNHSIQAVYEGDGLNFDRSVSNYFAQTVNQAATATSVTSSQPTSNAGAAVTFTATVTTTGAYGSPSGSVSFFDGTTPIGTANLNVYGVATLSYAGLNAGTHSITAEYNINGTGNFATSTSPAITQIVHSTTLPAVLVLNGTASGALSLSGNGSLQVAGVVDVDSNSSTAITDSGNASVTASAIDVVGGDKQSGNASFSTSPATGTAAAADPFAGLAAPSTAGLTNYGSLTLSGNQSMTINPGIYSQITVSGNAKLTLNPGIYIIAGGGITVSGNASVTGTGVLIYNAGSNVLGSGNSFGGITISGNATVNLTASSTGTYAGIAIFQSRDNASAITVSGNADLNLGTGVLYTPAAVVSDSGNAQLAADLIVNELAISGNGEVF